MSALSCRRLISCVGVALVFVVLSSTGMDAQTDVTFTKDVAPILQQKCEGCHRAGQMAPMPLATYEEVRPWARLIKSKVVTRKMPPWHIDKTVGIQRFVNDISLSDSQIDTIVRWVDSGAPRGDLAALPPPREWPSGERWRLGDLLGRPPDHLVRSESWTQPAEGADQWWQPVVDSGLTEERWIRAVEVRPTLKGRQIVHHGNARELVEYAVGKPGQIYSKNTGQRMRAGMRVRFDIHYHSVGEEITDFLTVGLWFYPKGEVPKYEVKHARMGSSMDLDIPPGTVTKHQGFFPLPKPTKLLSYQPHMHIRGKAMSIEAVYPDGAVEMLSHVDDFNFNWHINYVYEEDAAPLLPKGTLVRVSAWHDNTSSNRANPDPTQWVGWGQRSYDEMYHAHVWYVELTDEDYEQLTKERARSTQSRESAP
jgi:hypothetical protein